MAPAMARQSAQTMAPCIRIWGSGHTLFSLSLDQRAFTLIRGPEGLGGGYGGASLIVVPGPLTFLRFLDLEEIHVVDLAAVFPDRALAKQLVLGRHRLHLRDY